MNRRGNPVRHGSIAPEMHRPRLLISVRNAGEAEIAVSGGCDLLDLKEPARGSLGMVAPEVVRAVAAKSFGVSLSMALGELRDWTEGTAVPRLPLGLTYLKLGLSGAAGGDWVSEWVRVRESFEQAGSFQPKWIAVAYVDHRTAGSPPPEEVISAAIATGCGGVLFDTFGKQSGSLFDHLPADELRPLLSDIRSAGLLAALAGSLRLEHLPDVLPLGPDVIAVRGAVCAGGARSGQLEVERTQKFRTALRTFSEVK